MNHDFDFWWDRLCLVVLVVAFLYFGGPAFVAAVVDGAMDGLSRPSACEYTDCYQGPGL